MCYNPIKVFNRKTRIYESYSCRKCIECQQVRANEWGVLCHFELKEHKDNCFITLTYENNPVYLHKEHMQNFLKKLRKKIAPAKIKYFSCGEYGDKLHRPHYHLIIFGYDFKDKIFWKLSKSDKAMYISKELEDLWGYGLCTVQEANIQTVQYSAKYATKRIGKELPKYKMFPNTETGEFEKFPSEFNTMSQNLGVNAILKKLATYLKTNEIFIDGYAYWIPDKVLRKYVNNMNITLGEKQDEYNRIRQYDKWKITTNKELRERERRAKKKKLYTKLREL